MTSWVFGRAIQDLVDQRMAADELEAQLLKSADDGHAAVVDPGDAGEIQADRPTFAQDPPGSAVECLDPFRASCPSTWSVAC